MRPRSALVAAAVAAMAAVAGMAGGAEPDASGQAAAVAVAGESSAADPAFAAPNFSIAVNSSPLTTVQARAAATTVTTSISGGFNASITLSATGLPAGASATFAPAVIPAPGASSATLTLAAGAATPPGSYTVTVAGSGSSLMRTAPVTFVVTTTTVQIYSDGFEGSLTPNWELWVRPGATSAVWGKSSYRKAAGSFSAYCAGIGGAAPPAGGPYPANMEGWMIYGPFSLADATGALVTFKLWMNNHSSNDKLQIFVSLNNSAFYGVERSDPALTWQTVTFDLAEPYLQIHPVGQPQVWFALIFKSDGSGQSEGAYIDTVNITKTVSGPTCAVTCGATVPAQGVAGSPVQLAGTLGAGNCSGAPSFSWSFGDGTPGSSQVAPAHTYQAPGTYPWSMAAMMGGKTCSKNGSITVTAQCSLSCSATVPAAGSRNAAVSFHAAATATNCGSPPTYAWDFGDGSTAATADAQHVYTSRGSYPWTLIVTSGTKTCTKTGTLVIGEHVRRHLSRRP